MLSPIRKHFFWLCLTFAIIVSAGSSLLIGLQQSVWFDEAYSILVAEHSWREIVRLTAEDVHPPVYYWLLKAWMTLFGSGELALRSMSALFLGLSIGAAGLLVRRLFGVKAALVTLPFLVFAPFLLRYGFEIRMYAFVSFLGAISTYVLAVAVEEKARKRRWLLFSIYTLLVALGVYTLYFTALLWIAHLVWLMWLAYKERRREVTMPALASYAASFLLFLPWLPVFLGRAGGGTLSEVTHALGFENLYGIVTFLFLYRPSWEVGVLSVLAVVFIIAAIFYLGMLAYKSASTKERRYLALLAAYFIVPVLVLVVVTHIKPIYLERYVAHIAIGAYTGVGVLAALSLRSGKKMAKAVSVVLLAVLLVGYVNLVKSGNYNFQRLHRPSVEQVAGLLTDCRDGAIIFADGPQIAVELGYYITDCPVYFFNETLEMSGGFAMLSGSPLRVASASELPRAQTVLHVYYDEPIREVPEYFEKKSDTKIEALGVIEYQTNEL